MNLIVRELSDLAEKKAKFDVSSGLGNFDNLYRDNFCKLIVNKCVEMIDKDKNTNLEDKFNNVLNCFGISKEELKNL